MVVFTIFISPSISISQDSPPPDTGGRLYFTFISSAYYMDKRWGQGMPWDGIKRTAEIAHANGIPVTWLVNARSAEEGKDLFTEYHEKFGDEVGHIISVNKPEADRWGSEAFYLKKLSYKKLGEWIAADHNTIVKNLPWAKLLLGGAGYRSDKMVRVLEKLGYQGLWGHCWEQTLTDDISDRGAPWGFYYADSEIFKRPARASGGLVAVEWTARDLNLAFRTGRPETFSTDPNDVQRAGICDRRNIEYWKRFVGQYARNTKYNAVVPLAVHQEAHEMECSSRICSNSEETIESTAQMLDELFKYVKTTGAKIVTANEAIQAYRAANLSTPPTYALFDDVYKGENPPVLVYYDTNGQLFFEKGKIEPLLIRNYMENTDTESTEFASVPEMPAIDCRETAPGAWTCSITSPARLPCGLAFWGSWKEIAAASDSAANISTRILPGELAFVSFVAEKGANEIIVSLK